MSVRVRLTRVGSNKNPIWRVVVADQRSPRDGRFIETIGHYNPQTNPSTIVIDEERFRHWVSRGAQPTNTVRQLVKAHAKGVTGGTSTGSAGVSHAPAAVAEPEAAEAPDDVVEERAEAPAAEKAPAEEAAAEEAPAAEAEAPADDAASE